VCSRSTKSSTSIDNRTRTTDFMCQGRSRSSPST
jgi:hypothetical protein